MGRRALSLLLYAPCAALAHSGHGSNLAHSHGWELLALLVFVAIGWGWKGK